MNSPTSQVLTMVAWLAPLVTVMVVGIFAAIMRRGHHPAVSTLLVASMSTMLVAYVTIRLAIVILLANRGGASMTQVSVYVGLLTLTLAVIKTAVWGGVIAAMLGWRQQPGKQAAPLQFSIRGLIAVTLAVAVVCALMRTVVSLMGDMSPLLLQLVDDIPVIACLGIGIWIAASRWRLHPHVSHLAIWALGLALTVTIVPQVLGMAVTIASTRPVPSILLLINFGASLTSIVSWSLAIAAALGWRNDASLAAHPSQLDGPFRQ
jgi:hypothetical protein